MRFGYRSGEKTLIGVGRRRKEVKGVRQGLEWVGGGGGGGWEDRIVDCVEGRGGVDGGRVNEYQIGLYMASI